MQSLPNKITIRFFSWLLRSRLTLRSLVIYTLPLLVIWLAQVSTVVGQDVNSMPWVDQESGELSPVGIESLEPAVTRDRTSIPFKKIKPIKPPSIPTVGGSPFAGAWLSTLWMIVVYALIGAGVVALIVLVIWVFLNSRVDIGDEVVSSRPDRTLAESIRHLPFEMDVKQGDFRQQAEAAYRAGDFRRALVFLFSHVLVTLDQAKLVRLKKGKTNRQYLRELSPSRPLVNYYGDVMVPFEQTFFGDYPITKEVFEGCWKGLDEFQNSVDAARSKTARSKSVLSNVVHASAAGTSKTEGQASNV